MKINRRFTTPGQNVFATVSWAKRSSRITNADGSLVFEMNDAMVPSSWSQLATDIMVSKYFRKAGVPQTGSDGQIERDKDGRVVTGPERSAQQVIHRLAGCWRHWGERFGYFDSPSDAQTFYDELAWMLLQQVAAPNSPQWFNTGLNWAYGISGPPQGHWINDPITGETMLAADAYSHPQPHACFIQSVTDDLVNPGGIMDLWTREARLFKYGSGTGTNFSRLRGEDEPLSGGGKSSGLMSFLRIGDRAAGAIKSGGTTRRAAKMVCLDADHPDVEAFVNWKVREELKVAAMAEGLRRLPPEQRELAAQIGLKLDYDFNGEAYQTVSGQNSNNSLRLTDDFFRALAEDGDWSLTSRTTGKIVRTVKARSLWHQICFAAWRCADPGIQFDTTINDWHTCPASGRINASNPCSEYMFLDDTACNLASINLLKFYDPVKRSFDVDGYEHAIHLWTIVLEISVLMAAFPSQEIAHLSWKFRTLGLGFANLGAMLMQAGMAYDSDEARALCGVLSAILTGRAYASSALMAAQLGAFPGHSENAADMRRVIRNHRRAAYGLPRDATEYESLRTRPVPIDHDLFRRGAVRLANAPELLSRAVRAWDDALDWGSRYGFRNAQVSVIAPTGTIGLLMDCDTTGVEPDFALVKFKKLAGGGYFKIANASLRPALESLGYDAAQTDAILTWVMGSLSIDTTLPEGLRLDPPVSEDSLSGRRFTTLRGYLESVGYTAEDLVRVENQLPTCFHVSFAFGAWSMPESVLRSLGLDPAVVRQDPSFNGLRAMGLNEPTIDALNQLICGTQTVEGAPGLRPEHLPVFDCANRCGELGRRFIPAEGHIRMMAASQPFISGAISKTINLPSNATVEDVDACYRLSWELGLKANALYRDGSKLSQPLSTKATSVELKDDDEEEGQEEAREEVAAAVVVATQAIATDPAPAQFVERVVERIVERPMRRRLPDTRTSITHRFNVSAHEGYLTVGLYDDGKPGELFITMSKEGSTIGGLMDSLGTAISVALQYGVPIESLVTKFAHQRFEPMGATMNRDIPFAKSLVDYIFRWMGMEFIPGYREQYAPPRSTGSPAAHPQPRSAAAPGGSAEVAREESRWIASEPLREEVAANAVIQVPSIEITSTRISSFTERREHEGRERTLADPGAAGQYPVVISIGTSTTTEVASLAIRASDVQAARMQSDAPPCDQCGMLTVRNGHCYRCMNCGNSMGCS